METPTTPQLSVVPGAGKVAQQLPVACGAGKDVHVATVNDPAADNDRGYWSDDSCAEGEGAEDGEEESIEIDECLDVGENVFKAAYDMFQDNVDFEMVDHQPSTSVLSHLFKVTGTKQSYISYKDAGGKKKLLVSVSSSMSNNHKSIIDKLLAKASAATTTDADALKEMLRVERDDMIKRE